MDPIETACAHFQEGFNCAQSVLSAFAEQLELPFETALKIAAPFGGGIGRLGEVCGAVSGAMMVIGLSYGQTTAGDTEAKEKTYALAREFIRRFQERHGTILCRDLLGCEIYTPEGMRQAKELNLFRKRCPAFVHDAAEIVTTVITPMPGT